MLIKTIRLKNDLLLTLFKVVNIVQHCYIKINNIEDSHEQCGCI